MIRAGRRASRTPSSTASTDTSPDRERSIIRRTLTPPPSAAAIIEGLQQGNALELQTFETIKEGLISLITGLQDEGRNRSDALEELTEEFGVLSLDLSAAHKTKLTNIIKDGIAECKEGKDSNCKGADKTYDIINDVFYADLKKHDDASHRVTVRTNSLIRMHTMLTDLSRTHASPRVDEICNNLWREYQLNWEVHRDDKVALRNAKDSLYERAEEQKTRNDEDNEYVAKDFDRVIRVLKRAAKALGVENDLY